MNATTTTTKATTMQKFITIKIEDGEYQVPTKETGIFDANDLYTYFTDDKTDAINTAKTTHGDNVQITFRKINH